MSLIYGSDITDVMYKYKTKTTTDDTVPGYLYDLIQSADGTIDVTVVNAGGDEKLNLAVNTGAIGADTDEKVKVKSDSPAAKYLKDAIAGGTGISVTYNAGSDELEISTSLSFNQLSDVSGTASTGDIVKFTGFEWEFTVLELNDLSDVDTSEEEEKSILVLNSSDEYDARYKLKTTGSESDFLSPGKNVLSVTALMDILRLNYLVDNTGNAIMKNKKSFGIGQFATFWWETTMDILHVTNIGVSGSHMMDYSGSNGTYKASNTYGGVPYTTDQGCGLIYDSGSPDKANLAVIQRELSSDFVGDNITLDIFMRERSHVAGEYTYLGIQIYIQDEEDGEWSSPPITDFIQYNYDDDGDWTRKSITVVDDRFEAGKTLFVGLGIVLVDSSDANERDEINIYDVGVSYPTKKYNLDY